MSFNGNLSDNWNGWCGARGMLLPTYNYPRCCYLGSIMSEEALTSIKDISSKYVYISGDVYSFRVFFAFISQFTRGRQQCTAE